MLTCEYCGNKYAYNQQEGYSRRWCSVSCDYRQQLREVRAENAALREALETLTGVIGLTPLPYNREAVQEAFDLARAALAKRGEGADE